MSNQNSSENEPWYKNDPWFKFDENPPTEEEPDIPDWQPDDDDDDNDDKDDSENPGWGGGGGGGSGGGGGGGGGSGGGGGGGGNDPSWETDPEPPTEDEADPYEDEELEKIHLPCVLLRITDPERSFSYSTLDWTEDSNFVFDIKTIRSRSLKYYRNRHLAKSCTKHLMLGGPCPAYPAGLLWLPERDKPLIMFHFDWSKPGKFEVQARWQAGHFSVAEFSQMRIDTWGESTGTIVVPISDWKTVATIEINENGVWVNGIAAKLYENALYLYEQTKDKKKENSGKT